MEVSELKKVKPVYGIMIINLCAQIQVIELTDLSGLARFKTA